MLIVWSLAVPKLEHVLHVVLERLWEACAESLGGDCLLLFQYPHFFCVSIAFETLPGQFAAHEIYQHIAESFEVVAEGLGCEDSQLILLNDRTRVRVPLTDA